MVEAKLRGLAHQYQVVMKKCQQKRDLCIQCVNYHIGAQEVCLQRAEWGFYYLCVRLLVKPFALGITLSLFPLPQCEKWWAAASDCLSEDLLQDTSTEAVSVAIGSVDGQLESYPEASVSSLKKIAKHIPDKTFKKNGNRLVSKCHKVG